MKPDSSVGHSKVFGEVAWSTSSGAKQSRIWSEISTLLRFLRATGIVIPQASSDTKNSFTCACRVLGILPFAMTFVFIASEVAFCGITNFVTTPVVVCMSLTLSMSLMLWITTFRKRKQLSLLICRLEEGRLCFGSTSNVSNFQLYTRIASYYIVLVPILISILSILAVQSDDIYFYLHCYRFGYDTLRENYVSDKVLLFFFLMMENYTQFLLPNLATMIIFLLCEYMSNAIESYVEFCKSGKLSKVYASHRNSKELKILKFYKTIKENFKLLEDSVSSSIFLILSQKFVTLFFTLTVVLSKTKNLIQLIEAFFFSVNGILSITILIVSGSRIKEAHGKVKDMFLEFCSLLDQQQVFGLQDNEVLPVMKTFVEQEDMILTAAKMIPLTRSLFLKIGAALVTYGVLIAQFDSL